MQLRVLLQFCTDANASLDATSPDFYPANVSVSLEASQANAVLPSFRNVASGLSSVKGCVRLWVESEPFSHPLTLLSIDLTLEPPPFNPRRRRRADDEDLLNSTSVMYAVAPSHVVLVTRATDGGKLVTSQGGSLSLEDDRPPVLHDCPTDMHVSAALGSTAAPVSWTEPTVTDNVSPDPQLESSHAPGSSFSVIDSPHVVTYTASDGVQSSTCSFSIHVGVAARQSSPSSTLEEETVLTNSFPLRVVDMPLYDAQRWEQDLLMPGNTSTAPFALLRGMDPRPLNRLQFTLATPPARPLVVRTRPEASYGALVLRLLWQRWSHRARTFWWLAQPPATTRVAAVSARISSTTARRTASGHNARTRARPILRRRST